MTTRSILEKTAALLGLTVDFSLTGDTQSKFLSCLGYVLNELTTQYEDLRASEEVDSIGDKILFTSLTKNVIHVLSVKNGGRKVRFSTYPTYIKLPKEGVYKVEYTYSLGVPAAMTTEIILPPKYTAEILSMGVASEYLHRTGYDEDARFYGNRYFTALKNLAIKRKEIVLPSRRYL